MTIHVHDQGRREEEKGYRRLGWDKERRGGR